MELLSVENLTVEREGKTILRNVNFSLHKGEKVIITGPNGEGKTTFVETIMGFIRPILRKDLPNGKGNSKGGRFL
jgi:ABC-type Mn2+/Zn2+ transport system ATPase subunit